MELGIRILAILYFTAGLGLWLVALVLRRRSSFEALTWSAVFSAGGVASFLCWLFVIR